MLINIHKYNINVDNKQHYYRIRVNYRIEQVTEVKSELNPVNQTVVKQNKFITKWWDNN
jgi:hypothetical protein